VGTVLVFYFSKENFTAASQSVAEMARQVTGIERLRTIGVREKMRPVSQIKSQTLAAGAEGTMKLSDLLTSFGTFERILILDPGGVVVYLIYQAQINEYLSEIALGKATLPPPMTAATVTLKELIASDAKRVALFTTSFAFVAETATLADAKIAMDKIASCNDVFVTHTGAKNEPLLGWITDNTIIENSRV
jgi:hypothetical protein